MKPFFSFRNSTIKGKEIFLDNDFLNKLSKDSEFFKNCLPYLTSCFCIIDPFTAFEFTRDIYLPRQLLLREKFLSIGFFNLATNHQQIFTQSQKNALVLSRIYKHNNKGSSDTVDLLLAGRIMYLRRTDPYLITANKQHFPNSIFETKGIIVHEDSANGNVTNFYLLRFSKQKFESCQKRLDKISSLS